MAVVGGPNMARTAKRCSCILADPRSGSARFRCLKCVIASLNLYGTREQAIVTAAAIDPDAVTAKNAPVDASIMKEVEKAEKEQVLNSILFFLFSLLSFCSLYSANLYLTTLARVCVQADEMSTEKAFATGNEVVNDDGSTKAIKKVADSKKAMGTKSLLHAVGWKK